jgi:hypothetical protein
MSKRLSWLPKPIICIKTRKPFELIKCIQCENVCEPMKRVAQSPAKRRQGMTSEYDN